jgi:hypothetical protein
MNQREGHTHVSLAFKIYVVLDEIECGHEIKPQVSTTTSRSKHTIGFRNSGPLTDGAGVTLPGLVLAAPLQRKHQIQE